jgi:hypothetical protein
MRLVSTLSVVDPSLRWNTISMPSMVDPLGISPVVNPKFVHLRYWLTEVPVLVLYAALLPSSAATLPVPVHATVPVPLSLATVPGNLNEVTAIVSQPHLI